MNRRMLLLGLLALPTVALAHGGRTDGAGCHKHKKGRHCHGEKRPAKPVKQPPPPKKITG